MDKLMKLFVVKRIIKSLIVVHVCLIIGLGLVNGKNLTLEVLFVILLAITVEIHISIKYFYLRCPFCKSGIGLNSKICKKCGKKID